MKKFGLLACLSISIIFLSIVYNKAFFSPNKYLFSSECDGIKNYYNYVNHIKNDTSLTKLSGISYPYGENIFMEDSLPLMSTIIKAIAFVFPSINSYTIGILNFLLLISLAIGALFMYLIFRSFSIPPFLSAVSANSVCILSSQFLLLNPFGHWGLSFICFFPIGWYLLIRYFQNSNQIKWSILIAINILVWTYTHVYLGFIILFFTFISHFLKGIFEFKSYIKNTKNYFDIAIQIILPVLIIFSIIYFTDHHPDRINMPFIANYTANFYSVFVPAISPLKPLYNLFFDLSIQNNYLWCRVGNYIGLTSNLAIFSFVFISVFYFIIGKPKKILNFLPFNMLLFVLASFILLLFSMAVPIKYFSNSFLNIIPLIKQFSTLGRFAWAFYYVIVVFSMVLFYKLLYNKIWGKALLYFLVFLYIFEGSFYHFKESKTIIMQPNTFNKNYLPDDQKILAEINNKKFQAILPLPYYFKFSLPFAVSNSDSSIYSSMVASYYCSLPIISTYLSRPSVSESLKIFKQLMVYPYQKAVPPIVKDGREIAVIIYNSDLNLLNENEKRILDKCTVYLKSATYTIFDLSIDSLTKYNFYENEQTFNQIKSTLLFHNGLMVKDTNEFMVYYNFDSLKSSINYNGTGAFYGLKNENSIIFKTSTKKMDTSKEYIVSFWYYNYIWDQTFNTVTISESDSNGINMQSLNYSPVETNTIDGWWYLSEYKFKIKSEKSILTILFHGDNYFENWFAIDDFLIRPTDTDIYRLVNEKGKETIYKNNRKFIITHSIL